jgi:hypothetical protein
VGSQTVRRPDNSPKAEVDARLSKLSTAMIPLLKDVARAHGILIVAHVR